MTTYKDLIDQLVDYLGGNNTKEGERFARRAVQAAYQEMATSHTWQYFWQRGRLVTVPQQTTGTVTYVDATGTVTLTGATWPVNVNKYNIILDNFIMTIKSSASSTTLVLDPTTRLGYDLSSASQYTLYRDTYPLPADFRASDELINLNNTGPLNYLHPREWLTSQRLRRGPSTPRIYCVPTDHEILTASGWKEPWQLVIGERVMAYNHETKELAWQPLQDVAIFDYDGPVLSLERSGGKKRFVFTPAHRWPVYRKGSGKREMLTADQLTGDTLIPQKGDYRKANSTLSPRHAALLGWIITDGCGLWSKQHWNTKIVQSASKSLSEVLALTGTKKHANNNGRTGESVPVSREDRALLRNVIPHREDMVRVVCGLSREAAEAMWQAMFKAEGWTTEAGQQSFAQYVERNLDVMDVFQILSFLTGRVAHINAGRTANPSPWSSTDQRWTATACKSDYLYPDKNGGLVQEHFIGKVWCPKTPWGTWVMRHNGHMTITGNTFTGDNRYFAGMEVKLFPAPDLNYEFDYLYQRIGRPLIIAEYNAGSASTTSGSPTVSGSGVVWSSSMIGSVIRFSSDSTNNPTGRGGFSPAYAEDLILDVPTSTSITLLNNATATLSGVKYSISDPIDMDDMSMSVFLARECEKQLRLLRRVRASPEELLEYKDAQMKAWESDARNLGRRAAGMSLGFPQRLANMPRGADVS